MSEPAAVGVPTLAIVGRPNVGKSTLFNRIVGSRRAIVGDEPGITRDRLYGEANWRGHRLRIADTGGIIPEDKDFIPSEIFRQAKVALAESDAVIMVIDGRTEVTGPDLELARLMIRGGKPLFLAVNKIDSDKQERLADEFHRLGIRKLFPISAEHGRGVDDLLDSIFEALKLETAIPDAKAESRTPEKLDGDIDGGDLSDEELVADSRHPRETVGPVIDHAVAQDPHRIEIRPFGAEDRRADGPARPCPPQGAACVRRGPPPPALQRAASRPRRRRRRARALRRRPVRRRCRQRRAPVRATPHR